MAKKDKHFHYSRYGTYYKSYKVISAYGRNEVKVTQELYEERFILVGLVTKLTVFSSLADNICRVCVVCMCICTALSVYIFMCVCVCGCECFYASVCGGHISSTLDAFLNNSYLS